MGRCGCSSPTTCGCFFDATSDIVPTGTGAEGSPMVLGLAPGKRPTITCTSGTRPSAPLDGQMIYETDTGKVLVWDTATALWHVAANSNVSMLTDSPATENGWTMQVGYSGAVVSAGVGHVAFPTPFTNTVFVFITAQGAATVVDDLGKTLAGFDFYATRTDSGEAVPDGNTVYVDWLAVGA